ncbi:hypothetical protein ASPZODRAFT_129732 [Penicilliopsis zonata CBS 506.65]|uniref:Golgi apparatus membrane protein TVP38 n=1 Tax=Penicilliopsis zonata CBS 506.65 TaxID=1073090 RepID=A0A1L9SPV6_9EURO|nr:hypothetical protein ASPZODRAFT_129732 [Penicilliopsis zonata CBS 506.65]OJJ49292.1 hypothetical protein ASPZODRAFT_129732 [Penicilliopsis zonata CBS 506.65]
MPADYVSTARALSLPMSPEPHLDWNERRALTRHNSINLTRREAATMRDQILTQAASVSRRLSKAWKKMNLWQRVGVVAAVILAMGLGIGFMVFTSRVFKWLGPVAERWENSLVAYLVLWLCVFLVSFPPLVGWSTFGTVAGFIFGVWKGWLLYASATIVGSTCSFIVSRTVLSQFVNRLMERDKRFAALSLTLKYDGLKLLCMIRLCPLPYSLCNGAVSTFPTVQPLMYGLATAIVSPKLLIPAFIGSRVRILSDEDEKMSGGAKAVNVISIVVTIAIGIFTGIYIYKRTLARAKELEAQERATIRSSLQADHAARRPHAAFSDDPDTNAAATTLARDEEERIGFGLDDDDEGYDDNVELVLEEDNEESPIDQPYHDDDDADDDVFRDGDGSDSETYGLHTRS